MGKANIRAPTPPEREYDAVAIGKCLCSHTEILVGGISIFFFNHSFSFFKSICVCLCVRFGC